MSEAFGIKKIVGDKYKALLILILVLQNMKFLRSDAYTGVCFFVISCMILFVKKKSFLFYLIVGLNFLFAGYMVVDSIVKINFHYPLHVMYRDVISIILATNAGEASAFSKNIGSLKYIRALAPLVLNFAYTYISCKIKMDILRTKMISVAMPAILISLFLLPKSAFGTLVRTIPASIEEWNGSSEYFRVKSNFSWGGGGDITNL